MAKIYVSSTYTDLQDYREQVRLVLRKMGHEDVAMEYYVAEDKRPVDKCLEDVTECDLYIGIFAWRQGWVPDENNPKGYSITEMKYRQAQESGKPCFAFLLSEDTPWPRKFVDKDNTRIDQLREELSKKHLSGQHFHSPDNLGKLVAESIHNWKPEPGHTSPHTLMPEFDPEVYYAALKTRYQRLDLDALTPPQKEEYLQLQLRSIFVEQSVRENPPPIELPKEIWEKLQSEKEVHQEDLPEHVTSDDLKRVWEVYYEKPPRPVLDALTDAQQQYSVILGDPGSGKSTLARYVLLSLIDAKGEGKLGRALGGYVPFLIELRSYAGLQADNKCDTFLEFLDYLGKTEGWHLNEDVLHKFLKEDGRAVVVLDGLDEIFDPKVREQITRQIVGFASDYPSVRIIVTSRIVGYQRKILADARFEHFTLQDLDEKQITEFVQHWYELALDDRPEEAKERRQRILRSFEESASIRQIAGNPMLLTIMAIIGKHQELPRGRWKLYDHAASVLIEHWDVNKHLEEKNIGSAFIGEDDKKELLRRLAYKMQSGSSGLAGNYIHHEQLQAEFENYLQERYDQSPDRAVPIARAMIEQFRERNFILALYGANLYGFVHRAFLEYFCATAFVHRFEKTQELTLDQLKMDVYGTHWEDESWHEVLRLISSIIDEKFVGEIIDFLIEKVYTTWPKEIENRPPWNIALAVQCLGEVRNLSTLTATSNRLLKTVCSLFDRYVEDVALLIDILSAGTRGAFLEEQVLKPSQSIGTNWPSSEALLNWLKRHTGFTYSSTDIVYQLFGKFIGTLGKEQEGIHQILLNYIEYRSSSLRILVPYTLTVGWRGHPQTLPLLQDWAVNDTDSGVRRAAISALSEYFRDDSQTLPLLQDRAVNDTDSGVRRAAISALSEYFRDDSQTLPLLQDWAVNDTDSDVRRAAISALSEYFRDDSQTLPLLQDRAVNDTDSDVRRAAISALSQHFRDDSQTLPLLQDRAVNDTDSDVRRAAISALSEYFRDDSQTLPLLQDRAVNDTDSDVRRAAISALSQHFRDDSQTLPLLQDRAVNDDSPSADAPNTIYYPREKALETIAQYWPIHPETLPLLRDRAQKDPTDWLRKKAKELSERLSLRN